MPRLLHHAYHLSPYLPPLLQECRDLSSSLNELRWLTEHAVQTARKLRVSTKVYNNVPRSVGGRDRRNTTLRLEAGELSPLISGWRNLLLGYVTRRGRGEPLQYIIGTQPFGEVEVVCRSGVLIPRWETEVYTQSIGVLVGEFLAWRDGTHSQSGSGSEEPLRVLDLCTGTGCIPLALYEMLHRRHRQRTGHTSDGEAGKLQISVLGVDISPTAISLARRNLRHNISNGHLPKEAANHLTFLRADVLVPSTPPSPKKPQPEAIPYLLDALSKEPSVDVLTANPPYISPAQFSPASGRTARSVRKYEPSFALVPGTSIAPPLLECWDGLEPVKGDEFYHHILPLSRRLDVGLTVLEVGDTVQAGRVAELAARIGGASCDREEEIGPLVLELWFDDGRVEEWSATKWYFKGLEDGREREAGCHVHGNGDGEHTNDDQTSSVDQTDGVSARAVVIWRREWAEWRRRRKKIVI